MPEKNDPGKKQGEKRQFINEKIIKQPLTRGQILKRLLAFFFVAVLFGVVAAISFTVSRPFAARFLEKETTQPDSSISIPKDEPMETLPEPTEEVSTTQETEPIEDQVQSAIERYRYSIDDLNSLYGSLRTLAQKASKGIVQVHSVKQDVDWFDNPVETTGVYAGAVIASTRRELLILTPEAAVGKADSIKVTFGDGAEVDGHVKQKDQIAGMAVVSVNIDAVEESTWKTVETLSLGNSYTVKQGDLVIAVGSPGGMVYSIDYGFISYVTKNAQVVDGVRRALYSDICANTSMGTFFVNTSGDLVGWATEELQGDSNKNMTEMMGISDYKGILERLSNGLSAPYFGIYGQEVGAEMTSRGLPQGLYVQNCIPDGPAYNAGIQNGDVITKIGSREIASMKDFQAALENLESGAVVGVTVERNGRDQYATLEFQVTIGAR